MEKINTCLGKFKGEERTRVWIEGKRLTEAGFKVGARYTKKFNRVTIVLTLDSEGPLKVSSRGLVPIIDLSGKKIREFFEDSDEVQVTFKQGVITYKGINV